MASLLEEITQQSKLKNKVALLVSILTLFVPKTHAQEQLGMSGGIYIPTAVMREAGTFAGGASYMPRKMSPYPNHASVVAYIDFTPFPWVEAMFNESILKWPDNSQFAGHYHANRSVGFKLRPLKEGKWWPALAVGMPDVYTGGSDNYYQSVWGVATKTITFKKGSRLMASIGYWQHIAKRAQRYQGVFGGVQYDYLFKNGSCSVLAEYDTNGFNVGARALLFRHLGLAIWTHNFQCFAGGINYQYTIKY